MDKKRFIVIPGDHLGDREVAANSQEEAIAIYERVQGVELKGTWTAEDKGTFTVLRRDMPKPDETVSP